MDVDVLWVKGWGCGAGGVEVRVREDEMAMKAKPPSMQPAKVTRADG